MKNRDVYLRAAERVAGGTEHWEEFTCNAIKIELRAINADAAIDHIVEFYRTVMGFAGTQQSSSDPFVAAIHEEPTIDTRNLRVWLLCMMAACCDDMEGT